MDYKKIYDGIVNKAKLENRVKLSKLVINYMYYENHHIIPKCLKGSNNKENLVLLTPREHFIAHLLLTNMYTGSAKAKMCYAFMIMCACNPNQKRKISDVNK